MLGRSSYYHGTTKKIIVAFGSIFDNIMIHREGRGLIEVPLFFSNREKFVDAGHYLPDGENTTFDSIFPAIAFDIVGMNMAVERKTNPNLKIPSRVKGAMDRMSYNRVPYDIQFEVTVGAKTYEDSLKIIEQILPYFQPEITLTISDRDDMGLEDTNLTINLDSVSQDVQLQGAMSDKRTILWTLGFTAKAYYYMPVDNMTRIKEAITDFREIDYANNFDRLIERTTHLVVPRDAEKSDPHEIVTTIEEG